MVCPFCYQQFDLGQLMAARRLKLDFSIPVLFYLQLLGLAMGMSLTMAQILQPLKNGIVRVAVPVVRAHTDERHLRRDGIQERVAGGPRRTVMRHF